MKIRRAVTVTVVACAFAIAACTPPRVMGTTAQLRAVYDRWAAQVQVVKVPPAVLRGDCGFAPPNTPYKQVLISEPPPNTYCIAFSSYILLHEKAHTLAYRLNLWFILPGEVCNYDACPGAERAAESVLQAVGIDPPFGWKAFGGRGVQSAANVATARRAIWGSGL